MEHPIIDCDVHVYPRDPDELRKYLPLPWKHWYQGESRPFYQAKPPLHGSRQDAFAPDGGRPGTDPDTLRRQLIDQYGICHAILMPRVFANMYADPDYAIALSRAFNDWLADTWLSAYNADGCFRGSINVDVPHDTAETLGDGPWRHFLQVPVGDAERAAHQGQVALVRGRHQGGVV